MPVLKYFLIRLALFAVIFLGSAYLGSGLIIATIAATVGAMGIGYLAFPKQRREAAAYAAQKMQKDAPAKTGADEAAEDALEDR